MPEWKKMFDPDDFPDFWSYNNGGYGRDYSKKEVKIILANIIEKSLAKVRPLYKENWFLNEYIAEMDWWICSELESYEDSRYDNTYPMVVKRGTIRYHLLKDMKLHGCK